MRWACYGCGLEISVHIADRQTDHLWITGFERPRTYIERFKIISGILPKPSKEVFEFPQFEHSNRYLFCLAISFFSANGEFLNLDDTSAGSEMDELDADDSDSDGFWDQVKAESNEHSRLDEYMLDIQYTIASL
jgi:hypothetical protein